MSGLLTCSWSALLMATATSNVLTTTSEQQPTTRLRGGFSIIRCLYTWANTNILIEICLDKWTIIPEDRQHFSIFWQSAFGKIYHPCTIRMCDVMGVGCVTWSDITRDITCPVIPVFQGWNFIAALSAWSASSHSDCHKMT